MARPATATAASAAAAEGDRPGFYVLDSTADFATWQDPRDDAKLHG